MTPGSEAAAKMNSGIDKSVQSIYGGIGSFWKENPYNLNIEIFGAG